MVEHLDDDLPLGYLPAYYYDGGTVFVFVGANKIIEEHILPASYKRFWCPMHDDIQEQDISRLKQAVLQRLPNAVHIRVIRGAQGIGIYAARY